MRISEFRSPDRRIGCLISEDIPPHYELICNSLAGHPREGYITWKGGVSVCNAAHVYHFCSLGFPHGPILASGQQTEAHGFRCSSATSSITCVMLATGRGFRISTNEAVRVAQRPAAPQHDGTIYFITNFINGRAQQTPLIVRPAVLPLFESGAWDLEELHWTDWGSPVAHATGTSNASNGIPDLADGARIKTPGAEVTLSSPGAFRGHTVYRCVEVTVPPPASFPGRQCLKRVGTTWAFG